MSTAENPIGAADFLTVGEVVFQHREGSGIGQRSKKNGIYCQIFGYERKMTINGKICKIRKARPVEK